MGQRTAGMQDERDLTLDGWRKGGSGMMQHRRDLVEYSTSVMQESRDLDRWNSGHGMQDR